MKLKDSYNALVIVGAWNIPIFTPAWVGKYILSGISQFQIEFPDQPLNASLRFTHNNVSMYIADNRLTFCALSNKPETFKDIEDRAITLCRCLAHTPVQSFGINHIFECKYSEINDNNIFTFKDDETVTNAGYNVESLRVQRTIRFDNHVLNVIWSKNGEDVTIEFNNDYKIDSIAKFLELLKDGIIEERKNNAIEFLHKIYNITVE